MGYHGHMNMLEDLKRAAWSRTGPVSGQMNSWEFRKDVLGNLCRYADYGNRHSPFGWELEYVVARSAGGSTDPDNLQALHWKAHAHAARSTQPELRLQTVAEAEAARRGR
jgi:hypothetical protein